MSMLAANPELSFTEMRDSLGMTDGNITTHIRTLQEAGYLSVTKSFQKNRPLTTCALTPVGRTAFAQYINLLEQIVRQSIEVRRAEVVRCEKMIEHHVCDFVTWMRTHNTIPA